MSEETQETEQISQERRDTPPPDKGTELVPSEDIQEIEVAPEDLEATPEPPPCVRSVRTRRKAAPPEETLDAEDVVNFRELAEPGDGTASLPGQMAHVRLTDLAAPVLCRIHDLSLDVNDFCVVKNPDGEETTGYVINFPLPAAFQVENRPVWDILRRASSADVQAWHQLRRREREAMVACKQKTVLHNLDMKVSQVRFDDRAHKVIFYFTADKRVDFRELVKDLASTFHARIELWQVGVRDEAKQVGGLGCCGRQMCCCSWMREFMPVSIRYAKVQDIQFSPTKLSGVCGRLRCCLSYEQDQYVELAQDAPAIGALIESAQYGNAKVVDRNLLTRVAVITSEEGKYVTIPFAQLRLLDKGDPKVKANKKSSVWQLLTEAEARAAAGEQAPESDSFTRRPSARPEPSAFTAKTTAGKPERRPETTDNRDRSDLAPNLDKEDEAWLAALEEEEETTSSTGAPTRPGGRDRRPNGRNKENRGGNRDSRGKEKTKEKERIASDADLENTETEPEDTPSALEEGDKDGAQKSRRRRSRRRRSGSGQTKDSTEAPTPNTATPTPNRPANPAAQRPQKPQRNTPPDNRNSEKTPAMHKNKKHPDRKTMRPPQHSRHN